ncbi:MAG: ribose transport system ATP-binding protein [Subtercola sp.]|nr:ribose transport system ATP-binding protein [Subtercola sp.]
METEYALEVSNVSKTFENSRVLKNIDLRLKPGEIHALVGENGSGKSTLVKILAGIYTSDDDGEVLVAGAALPFGSPSGSEAAGLSFVHQDLGLVESLGVVDNLALGPGYRTGRTGTINWRREERAAREALLAVGYDIDVTSLVGDLAISERTALAIARALSSRNHTKHVLILDEPTANLPGAEVERLFALLRRLSSSGLAILFISHHFDEIFALADYATVLRDGAVVATTRVGDVQEDELVELMLGRKLEPVEFAAAAIESRDIVFTARNLTGEIVDGVDFSVHSGEVLGIAGLTGTGRDELARLLSGDLPYTGTVEVEGVALTPARPDRALGVGLAYVPAERKLNALLPDMNVRENLTISNVKPFLRRGALNKAVEEADTMTWLDRLDVRPRSARAAIDTLSGGNQQKVVIARALRLDPKVLVLDEPTQGVDVGAQAEIYRLVRESASAGLGAVICSSSSEELAQIADRVLVFWNGRIVTELTAPINPDQITAECLRSRLERTA